MAVCIRCLLQSMMMKIHSYSIFHKVSMSNTSFCLILSHSHHSSYLCIAYDTLFICYDKNHCHSCLAFWSIHESTLTHSGFPPPQVLFKCTPPFYTFKQAPRFNMVGVYFCVLNRLLRSFVYISVPIQIISTVTLLLVVHLKQCMAEPTWQCIYLFLFLVFLSQSGKFLGLCTLKCVLYVFFKLSALELFVNCWK